MSAGAALLDQPPDAVKLQYYSQVLEARGCPVEVRLDAGPGRGKGLFATCSQPAGALLFEEQPLAGMQHLHNRSTAPACSQCFRHLGSLERQVGSRLCALISSLSEELEDPDPTTAQHAQHRMLQIQEHVSTAELEGLMEGRVTLPATHLVPLPQPVPCSRDCGEEYCSTTCRDVAWQQHHCLLCTQGATTGGSNSSRAGGGASKASSSSSSKLSRSRRGGGGGSSSRPPPLEQPLPGVAVNRSALQQFLHHAADSNDALLLAARILAAAALQLLRAPTSSTPNTAGVPLKSEGVGQPGAPAEQQQQVATDSMITPPPQSADANQQQVVAATSKTPPAADKQQQQQQLAGALLPWSVGHKALWWEAVPAPQELVSAAERSEFRAQLQELVGEGVQLLRAAWVTLPARDQLLQPQVVGQLLGLFELNNLELAVPSPVATYWEVLEDPGQPLGEGGRAEAAAATWGLREALGEEAGLGVEGTAFYALHSCINHSCCPNAEVRPKPEGGVEVVALRPIEPGEELLLSYIDEEEQDVAARNEALKDYGFVCDCARCHQQRGAAQAAQS